MLKLVLKYGAGEGLAKGCNILLLLLLPLLLTIENYSKVVLILALEQILCSAILFSQNTVFTRWYQKAKNKLKPQIEWYCNQNIIFSASVVLFLLLSINLVFGSFRITIQEQLIILMASFFFSLNELTFNKLRLEEKHKSYIQSKLVNNFLKLTLCLVFVFLEYSYLSYLYAFFIANAFTLIITFKSKKIIFSEKNRKTNKNFRNMIMLFSLPLGIQSIINISYTFVDRLFIEKYLGADELALYGNSFTISSLIVFFINIYSIVFVPKYYKKSIGGINDKYINLFTYYSFLTLLVYCVFVFFSYDKFISFYNSFYKTGKYLTLLLCFSYFFHIIYLRFLYISNFIGFIKYLPIYSFLSLLLNSYFNYLLIPYYGVYGAAFSTIISEAILGTFLLYNYRKGKC